MRTQKKMGVMQMRIAAVRGSVGAVAGPLGGGFPLAEEGMSDLETSCARSGLLLDRFWCEVGQLYAEIQIHS